MSEPTGDPGSGGQRSRARRRAARDLPAPVAPDTLGLETTAAGDEGGAQAVMPDEPREQAPEPDRPALDQARPATDRDRRTRGRSRAASAAAESRSRPVAPGATAVGDEAAFGADRPTGLRLARLHLRMGSLALARAELEAYAGRGALDEDALLDLAEVRWRTGDLAGAGEAASSLIALGHEDPLALTVAAEAVAGAGRPSEARRLAARAVAAAPGRSVDSLFAGMPRSPIWPEPVPDAEAPAAPPAMTRAASSAGVTAGGVGEAPDVVRDGDRVGAVARPAPRPTDGAPASPAAAEAMAGGLAALGAGDTAQAALRLGVALRLEPAFAEAVLDAIGDRAAEPQLALVAGDAHRLLGREAEALAAFDLARGHRPDAQATEPDPG